MRRTTGFNVGSVCFQIVTHSYWKIIVRCQCPIVISLREPVTQPRRACGSRSRPTTTDDGADDDNNDDDDSD